MTVSVDHGHRARTQKESDSGCLSGVGLVESLHQQHSLKLREGSVQTIEYLLQTRPPGLRLHLGPRERPSSLMYEQVFAEALQQLGLPTHQTSWAIIRWKENQGSPATPTPSPQLPNRFFAERYTAGRAWWRWRRLGLTLCRGCVRVGMDDIDLPVSSVLLLTTFLQHFHGEQLPG